MKKFLAGLAALSVAALTTLCACNKEEESSGFKRDFFAMSTYATLYADKVEEADFEVLADKVRSILYAADNSLSALNPNSYISKYNSAAAGETVEINQTCYEVLILAKEVYEETDGYFNPAVYYSKNIYGFAARPANSGAMPYDRDDNTKTLPDTKYVTAFKELAEHFSEVEIFQSDGTYYATKPDYVAKIEGDSVEYSLALDLGGIAKGWCVDKVNGMLEDAGVEYGYFNFGESSISVKAFAGGDGNYSVAANDPRGSGSYAAFKMKNANLSTSGDNRQYYVIDGTRYCHIISPVTGEPIQTGVASVTVVGGSAGRADALTTALAAMGRERAEQFIKEKLSECKVVMLVFEDGAGKALTNAPEYFEIKNYEKIVIS